MEITPQPKIFLSYAWANVAVANEIDSTFMQYGITFLRDVRDIPYTGNIKEFMHQITKSDFVAMLISEEYIKSENCMYEVMELLNAHEFEKRILPIIIGDLRVFNADVQSNCYDYWSKHVEITVSRFQSHPNEKTLSDKKKSQNIYNSLGVFFQKLSELKCEKYEELKTKNYKPLLDKIGFDSEEILEAVISVSKSSDVEFRELALENLPSNYRESKYVIFQKARNAEVNKQYKLAKNLYEKVIKLDSMFVLAHNNLGLLLENHFDDFDEAKNHYILAIKHNPEYAEPFCNIALLYSTHYSDFQNAKAYYERAIEINPQHVGAMVNLGNLLRIGFQDFDKAANLYERVIEIDPENYIAIFNYALMLEDNYEDYDNAKKLLEKVVGINPKFDVGFNSLGVLLVKHFDDYVGARRCFEKAIEINPINDSAIQNLESLHRLASK